MISMGSRFASGGCRLPVRPGPLSSGPVVQSAGEQASYCYQDRLFDKEVRELNASAVLNWRKRFRQRLDRIAERYPPRMEIDLDDLADMLSVIADGGIILSKTIKDKHVLARQMMLYRDFIKAVFLGVP